MILLSIGCSLLVGGAFLHAEDSYSYDYWGELQHGPDPYRVKEVLGYQDFSPELPLRDPRGLFIRGDIAWICDTGNKRILEIFIAGEENGTTRRVIDSFINKNGVEEAFESPTDLYVDDKGVMYICDTDAGRVLKLDRNRRFMLEFTKPTDPTFDQNLSFMPMRVVADRLGRAFVLSKNINRGLIKYENDASFIGFFGASEVSFNWSDYVWKLLSTRAQREQMASFVPTEYENIAVDSDGFIYATTMTFETWKLLQDQAKPIRRLNALGNDILIKNGEFPPIGDLSWGVAAGADGPSKLNDITVFDSDRYVALDETRARLFAYDAQGNLLFAFGGRGNSNGRFRKPVALDHRGRDLYVMDAAEGTITVFTPTEYGNAVYDALDEYNRGDYDASAARWQDVLRLNGNYDLAYIGLGKAYFREENYKKAMEYFELKRSEEYYAKAFALYRKDWVEDNIVIIFIFAVLLLAGPPLVGHIRRVIREVEHS